jgi:hypothetical protein
LEESNEFKRAEMDTMVHDIARIKGTIKKAGKVMLEEVDAIAK